MSSKSTPQPTKSASRGPMGGPMGGGPMGAGARTEKAKDFKGTAKKLLQYVKPFWVAIGVVFVFAIASTIFAIAGPKILGRMTNEVVNDYTQMMAYDQITTQLPQGTVLPSGTTGADLLKKAPAAVIAKIPQSKLDLINNLDFSKRPGINFDKLKNYGLILLGLYLLSALFSYIQGWLMSGISQKITYNLRQDISRKINRLPLRYFDSQTHGEILSRVTNDVDTISQTLNQSLTQVITSFTMIVGILIMMLSINWLLTIVALVILPASFALISIIIKKSQGYYVKQQEYLGKINGHVEEMFSGHNIVKVFNGEKESIRKFQQINHHLYDSAWKSQFLSGLMMPIMNFMGNISYVAIAVLGGWLAIKGKLDIGDIQAFIQYVRQFNQPIAQTANIANILQSTAAAAERVFVFLNEKEEIAENANPVVLSNIKGQVEFNNVVFGYEEDKTIIHNFQTNIQPGQRVAIVGPTGAGKTTIVNLLMRFYDVNQGSIKIDGIDIKEMRRADLRKLFGMVLQDTWLFNGTIRDNILYGNREATNTEIEEVAKTAHIDHFIHSLPNGYDLVLNEESDNISQGERQLLTIARAMLADPPILILDEATSSVDTRTEVLIQRAMENLMKNRTSFVIAHRLSTIIDADLILVMKEGSIIEQGKHEDLLIQKGFYASLYNSQFAE